MMKCTYSENRMMKAGTTENQVMPRNGREGTHRPFCLSQICNPSSDANFPVNWAKDEPDMSKSDQFGEKLETPHACEHLHKVNQTPYPNLSRKKIEARTQVFIETIQTKKTFRIKRKQTHIPLKPKRRN